MMNSLLEHLVSVLTPEEIVDLQGHTSRAQEITIMKNWTAKKRKFDHLQEKNHPPNNSWVVNYSNKVLSPNEKVVLKKGMNFAVTPRQISVDDVMAGVEGGSDVDRKIQVC